jgi:UDP-glucose 4-epimerase
MKNILVTGGFGFIGSHLVEALLGIPDNQVHVVDDMSTSPINVQSYLRQLQGVERLTYSLSTVHDYFRRTKIPVFDEVYHLASVLGPVRLLNHSGEILRSIVEDTYDILDYCVSHKARLVDFSTGEVYGGGNKGVCREDGAMIVPPKNSARLEYAVGKLGCEIATRNVATIGKIHATIVRPFNVTGPRQAPAGGFVLPRFISQALAGTPLTVYGNGSQVRAFTHVQDIARGVILMMERGTSGAAYNIGNPANKTTVLELAQLVVKTTASASEISFVDPTTLWGALFEECPDRYPDVNRAITELDWQPCRGLDEIVHDSARYMRDGRCD